MKKTTAFLAAIAFFTVCSAAYAYWSATNEGTWPKSWPKELESLRKQSRSCTGGVPEVTHYQLPFTKRNDFESTWPHILKIKSEGAPLILVRGPLEDMGKRITAGVIIWCPPPHNRITPAAPMPHVTSVRARWSRTTFIELVVDGDIVDLNRLLLPADTPVIDERFKDGKDK